MLFNKYNLFIVTEELGESLFDRFVQKNPRRPTDQEFKFILRELFGSLAFLRKHGVLHCDIKPENILFDVKGTCLKLVDFGSASFCDDCGFSYLQTKPYRAPEITMGGYYDFSVDIWSVGCIIYELITSQLLFPYPTALENLTKALAINKNFNLGLYSNAANTKLLDKGVLWRSVEDGVEVLLPQPEFNFEDSFADSTVNPKLIDLLKHCLRLDPAQRITPEEALSHPYLANIER